MTAGWVLLIDENFEQARVIVALLVSIGFLALHVAVKPLERREDGALMMFVELAMVFTYLCVLLIKVCDMSSVAYTKHKEADAASAAVCRTFGLGDDAKGKALRPSSLARACQKKLHVHVHAHAHDMSMSMSM